jgi:hypothetical protein
VYKSGFPEPINHARQSSISAFSHSLDPIETLRLVAKPRSVLKGPVDMARRKELG